MNANQLAQEMEADYKTTRQHLELMLNNRLLVKAGGTYSVTYFPSPELEAHWSVFDEILSRIKEEEG